MNELGKDSSDINLKFDVILHALRLKKKLYHMKLPLPNRI